MDWNCILDCLPILLSLLLLQIFKRFKYETIFVLFKLYQDDIIFYYNLITLNSVVQYPSVICIFSRNNYFKLLFTHQSFLYYKVCQNSKYNHNISKYAILIGTCSQFFIINITCNILFIYLAALLPVYLLPFSSFCNNCCLISIDLFTYSFNPNVFLLSCYLCHLISFYFYIGYSQCNLRSNLIHHTINPFKSTNIYHYLLLNVNSNFLLLFIYNLQYSR